MLMVAQIHVNTFCASFVCVVLECFAVYALLECLMVHVVGQREG